MSEEKEKVVDTSSIESLIQMTINSTERSNLETRALDTQENIVQLLDTAPAQIKDHYSNTLTATGNADKVQSFTSYGFSNDTLNWTLWLALYNDSWVFRRAIDKPAQDEVKSGFTIHGKNDFTKVYKLYDKYKSDMVQLLSWGALFGGAVGVVLFENIKAEDMAKPIDKKAIKGKRFKLYVTDRWYGGYAQTDKMVSKMSDIDYGKPMFYEITFPDGKSYTVHHSFILRYEHRYAPPLIKNGQLQGWGYAEGSHIINELSRDDQLKASITSLINKALIEVIKMKGMRGVFMGTDKGNEAQLRKRLEMVNWGRNYNSLTFLDKDDEYSQNQLTAIDGLAKLLETNMWYVAAALEMENVLYGDLKGGLSNESDAYKKYSETIKSRCDAYFRPVLHKFLKIIYTVLDINEEVDFDFDSLNKIEETKQRVDSINQLGNVLSTLEQNGILSKYQSARTIQEFINNGTINITITEEHLNKLKLEEEQDILDTIEALTKKGRKVNKPNFDKPANGGGITMSGSDFEETDEENVEEPQTSEMEENIEEGIDVGENTNEEVQQ